MHRSDVTHQTYRLPMWVSLDQYTYAYLPAGSNRAEREHIIIQSKIRLTITVCPPTQLSYHVL